VHRDAFHSTDRRRSLLELLEARLTKFYVGLATSFHDPAIAVVDQSGSVVFAEASERYLQDKRALGAPADVRHTVRRLVNEYCDKTAEYVIAKSWSRKVTRGLELLNLLGLANHEKLARRSAGAITRYLVDRRTVLASVWQQYAANQLSGGHFADVLLRLGNDRISYQAFSHHLTHAASGCFTSPFENAACMVVDGQGEGGSISYFAYHDRRLRLVHRTRGAESLGLLYAFCTELCGFSAERGEYWKVMGLAGYGKLDPEIHDAFKRLVRVDGLRICYPRGSAVRGWVRSMKRWARSATAPPLEAADLAFTTQYVYAEVMNQLLINFANLSISENLVLAGGCALNSSHNGQIVGRTGFTRLHVPSAPADDGSALGAALLAFRKDYPDVEFGANVHSPYLGSVVATRPLHALSTAKTPMAIRLGTAVSEQAARMLADGQILGWIQGRSEFGPRALGNRSILADPRQESMKSRINAAVKCREAFRPFAPAVLDEFGPEYFEDYQFSPYMERTFRVRPQTAGAIPAVVHVDGTSRVQSVRREWNERFHDLIQTFQKLTGIPMLLNTSFNVMGKPIVHSVEDALALFYTSELDALVVEDYVITK
jgi:carbamoyltransferase